MKQNAQIIVVIQEQSLLNKNSAPSFDILKSYFRFNLTPPSFVWMTMSDSHTWWCDTRSVYFLNPRRTTKSCWKHPNKQNKTLFISTEGAKVSQEAKNVTAKRSEYHEIIEHYVRRSRYSVSTPCQTTLGIAMNTSLCGVNLNLIRCCSMPEGFFEPTCYREDYVQLHCYFIMSG